MIRTQSSTLTSTTVSQQYERVLQQCNNCLVLLRKLRNRVMRLHSHLFHSLPQSEETWPLEVQTMETNWNEGNFQTYTYLREFFRLQRRRRPSSIVPRPLSCSYLSSEMSPHAQFESAFAQFLLKNKTGILSTFLERTAVGGIVELKYDVLFEEPVVLTQKMLMIENAGVVEQVLFVAPHEEWSFYTDLGEKKVDLSTTSQYVLSVEANLHQIRWTAQILRQLSSAFGIFQRLFDMTCRSCKNGIKDLPPLIFGLGNLKNALQETCL
uniref:DHC_N2 domain-containing protein n=1 Tax=Angiostrongylus cantonensis TaxID=6313 RepID=A0A0K0DL77_ANGCA